MICTGEPFVVFVQLVGKVLVSRLYLSPPYSITILLEKTEFVLGMYGGPLVLLPFIRYLFSNKIIGNLSLTKSFFCYLLCFCISVWCCLVLKNRAKWMKEYIYIYSNLSSEVMILFLFLLFFFSWLSIEIESKHTLWKTGTQFITTELLLISQATRLTH